MNGKTHIKRNRHLKTPKEMVVDTVSYPFRSVGNFGKTAVAAGFVAQTGAVGFLGYKYGVKPCREIGESIDDSIHSMYKIGKDAAITGQNLIDQMNLLKFKLGISPEPEPSDIQQLVDSMIFDVRAELSGNAKTKHTGQELKNQEVQLKKMGSEAESYVNTSQNNEKLLIDMLHQYRGAVLSTGEAGKKVIPDNPLFRMRSYIYEKISGKSGEQYETNFEQKEEAYQHLAFVEGTTKQALGQVLEDYQGGINHEGADSYALRQKLMDKSLKIFGEYKKVSDAKKVLEQLNPNTNITQEEINYHKKLEAILEQSKQAEIALTDQGFDFKEPPQFASYAFPLGALLIGVYAYAKLMSYERKLLKGARNAVNFVRDCLYKEADEK